MFAVVCVCGRRQRAKTSFIFQWSSDSYRCYFNVSALCLRPSVTHTLTLKASLEPLLLKHEWFLDYWSPYLWVLYSVLLCLVFWPRTSGRTRVGAPGCDRGRLSAQFTYGVYIWRCSSCISPVLPVFSNCLKTCAWKLWMALRCQQGCKVNNRIDLQNIWSHVC